jgi:hypothetical protein
MEPESSLPYSQVSAIGATSAGANTKTNFGRLVSQLAKFFLIQHVFVMLR